MNILAPKLGRRSVLLGGAAAVLAMAVRPRRRVVRAQPAPALTAVKVDRVPTEPDDSVWAQAEEASITLSPQNLVLPRLQEAGASAVNVRALFDDERLAVLLEWVDAHRDVDLGTVMDYRDGVAIQLPEDLAAAEPSFMMGQADNGVVIYHWKSDWQFGRLVDVDEAYPNMFMEWYPFSGVEAGRIPEATDYLTTGRREYLTAAAAGNPLADPRVQETVGPVQKMHAQGFGTIEPDETQDGSGKGLFQDGSWLVTLSIPLKQAKYTITEGAALPMAFAVWDGSRDERNGQKAYSLWNRVAMGSAVAEPTATATPPSVTEPTEEGGGAPWGIIGGIAAVIAAGVGALLAIRLRGQRRESRE